ncbi:MAG: hypothetical protein BAX61_13260 [Psychrobacter sp. B29-1]|uniref:hypothetical protein n=1 Tax=Psychrobacter sp. B29-1 TaxID=1867800 RepID=UPI00086F8357|nr:hypothetical protein [Psychrobacter sp. B29-1]OEH66768.1 MAG: hypothetical protein BAX61_13260 [Psychrobacter sp. B29-1]
MGLPKDLVEYDVKVTFPSERDYKDTSKSTLLEAKMTDPAKSGADYGIEDVQVTKPIEVPDTGA